ncbi:hypothetical protein DM02DRAFT_436997 [Periconia macrospinosa]|uniref:PiggyBac transposable element-derived protein 4 C-terminal zinc-ribbon domain-containing protein n=1 Tax=Periconia macrospinosa TaxID=97972 RepID=A0A2V1DPU0_9PLEO|nr:hypothetical protein DM02DRAFT_436997 [Periconia macrospinosa]
MAAQANCNHSFRTIKSDHSIIQWNCHRCHSGPHSSIYECSSCKIKCCQPCTSKA